MAHHDNSHIVTQLQNLIIQTHEDPQTAPSIRKHIYKLLKGPKDKVYSLSAIAN